MTKRKPRGSRIEDCLDVVAGPLDTPCHVWPYAKNNHGYGVAYVHGRAQYVHRVMYARAHGECAPGMDLDHLCRKTACANALHLEAVTHAENIQRGYDARPRRTHCRKGHPLTPANTRPRSDNRGLRCLTCEREATARRIAEAEAVPA